MEKNNNEINESVRQAMHDYVKAEQGSKALRIGVFSFFALAFLYLVWDTYHTVTAIGVAVGIVLLAAYLCYRAGAFSSIDTLVSQMDYDSIEDLREEGRKIRKPWYHVAVVAAFMIIWTLFQYLGAFVGWENDVRLAKVLLDALVMGVLVDVLRVYFFRRDAKKLLSAVDSAGQGEEE